MNRAVVVFLSAVMAGGCALGASVTLRQGVGEYTGCGDTNLVYSDDGSGSEDTNYSTDDTLSVVRDRDNWDYPNPSVQRKRAAIRFDVSSIPTDATVTSASLKLWVQGQGRGVVGSGGLPPHQNVQVHAITANWTTNEATWNKRTAAEAWTSPGGDFGPPLPGAVVGTDVLFDTVGSFHTFTIPVSAVQSWVDTPSSNMGLLLKLDDDTAFTASQIIDADFRSADFPDSADRPALVVAYELPPSGTIVVTPSPLSVEEGSGNVTFTVSRTSGAYGSVSVDYDASDVTAISGVDYTLTGGTFSWADGESDDKTFTVDILDPDVIVNSDRTFEIVLSNLTGGATAGAPNPTIVTITDDDNPGFVSLVSTTYQISAEGDSGSALLDIALQRTGGRRGAVSVLLTTTDGSAIGGSDFTAVTDAPVTWADDVDGVVNYQIEILGDTEPEIDETFTVTIATSNPVTVPLGTTTTATAYIANDDLDSDPPLVVVDSPVTGDVVSVTVAMSGTADDNVAVVSVELSVDGGAYVPVSGIVVAASQSWSTTWDSRSITNGDHTLTVRATDFEGNTATDSVTVTVDNVSGDSAGCLPSTRNGNVAWFALLAAAVLAHSARRVWLWQA
jgi:hypothetical protein